MSSQQVAVITGAGRGMGAAIARNLAGQGYAVALLSPSGAAETLAEELGGIGVTGSVTEEADLKKLVDLTMDAHGRIDGVVNSTGHPPKGSLLEIPDGDWHVGLDIVFLNVVRMARLVTPIMVDQGGGSIVNISTFAAFEPEPHFPVSTPFRAALASFTKIYADNHGGGQHPDEQPPSGFHQQSPGIGIVQGPCSHGPLRHRGRNRGNSRFPAVTRIGLHYRPEPEGRRGYYSIGMRIASIQIPRAWRT